MGWGIFWSIVSGLAFLFGFGIGISMLKRRKNIMSMPLRDIGKLTDGLVSIQGRAKQFVPCTGPFSGEEVVYYEAKAKQMKIDNKNKAHSNSFDTIYEDKSEYPFFIEDNTGRILVSPNDAFINITPNFFHDTYKQGVGQIKAVLPPPNIAATLDEHGIPYTAIDGALPLAISEANLAVDTPLYAMGLCSSRQEDIDKALGDDITLEPTDDVPKVLISGGESEKDKLYIALGDYFAATHELLRDGIIAITVGGVIGLAAAAGAAFMFLN